MTRRLLLVAALLVASCHHSDEEIIRARLAKAASAAEDADVRGVTDLIADDFRGQEDVDKPAIKAYLASLLLRGQRVTVVRRSETISVDGPKATASFDAALLSGDRKSLHGAIPSRMGTWHFELTLAKRDGEWLVTKATWKSIPASQFVLDAL